MLSMDSQFAASIIKILIFLPIVILLAYICLRLGGNKMAGMGKGRIIKIVEKVPLSGKSFLCVVLINNKPFVIGCSEEKFEVLMELPPEALDDINNGNGSFKENMVLNFHKLMKRKDL